MAEDDDRLQAIWASSPPPDTDRIMMRLARINREHRRINRISFAAGWVTVAGLVVAEAYGHLHTFWLAPLAAALAQGLTYIWYRRSRRRLEAAYSNEPQALLQFTLKRAWAGLWAARQLYAALPLAMLAGWTAGFATSGEPLVSTDAFLGIGFMLALSTIAVWYGRGMAKRRRAEIAEISERARRIDPDV